MPSKAPPESKGKGKGDEEKGKGKFGETMKGKGKSDEGKGKGKFGDPKGKGKFEEEKGKGKFGDPKGKGKFEEGKGKGKGFDKGSEKGFDKGKGKGKDFKGGGKDAQAKQKTQQGNWFAPVDTTAESSGGGGRGRANVIPPHAQQAPPPPSGGGRGRDLVLPPHVQQQQQQANGVATDPSIPDLDPDASTLKTDHLDAIQEEEEEDEESEEIHIKPQESPGQEGNGQSELENQGIPGAELGPEQDEEEGPGMDSEAWSTQMQWGSWELQSWGSEWWQSGSEAQNWAGQEEAYQWQQPSQGQEQEDWQRASSSQAAPSSTGYYALAEERGYYKKLADKEADFNREAWQESLEVEKHGLVGLEVVFHQRCHETGRGDWVPATEAGEHATVLYSAGNLVYVQLHERPLNVCGWAPTESLQLSEPYEFCANLLPAPGCFNLGLVWIMRHHPVKTLEIVSIPSEDSAVAQWNKDIAPVMGRNRLMIGDWIVGVNGVSDAEDLSLTLSMWKPNGRPVMLRVLRAGGLALSLVARSSELSRILQLTQ